MPLVGRRDLRPSSLSPLARRPSSARAAAGVSPPSAGNSAPSACDIHERRFLGYRADSSLLISAPPRSSDRHTGLHGRACRPAESLDVLNQEAGIGGVESEWRQVVILHPLGEGRSILRRGSRRRIDGELEHQVECRSELIGEILRVLVKRPVIECEEADAILAQDPRGRRKWTVPTASPPFARVALQYLDASCQGQSGHRDPSSA